MSWLVIVDGKIYYIFTDEPGGKAVSAFKVIYPVIW
jgi:hypothetical protein